MARNLREIVHDLIFLIAPKAWIDRMSSCQRVSERISYAENQTLTERIETSFHVAICQACWLFSKQIAMLAKELRIQAHKPFATNSQKRIEAMIAHLIKQFSKNR